MTTKVEHYRQMLEHAILSGQPLPTTQQAAQMLGRDSSSTKHYGLGGVYTAVRQAVLVRHGLATDEQRAAVMRKRGVYGKAIDAIILDDPLPVASTVASEEMVALAAPQTDWGCCEDPQPRIHDATSRIFCFNCKRWLDRRDEQRTTVVRVDEPSEGTAGEEKEGQS